MEEAGILEKITRSGFCYPALNQVEQVRKLAGWGLTQNDIASFVGCSQSLISLGF
jgi:hypothetical protein